MKFENIPEQIRRLGRAFRAATRASRGLVDEANQNELLVEGLRIEVLQQEVDRALDELTVLREQFQRDFAAQLAELRRPEPRLHLNPSDRLPVVGARLWIETEPGVLVKAVRTGFIPSKDSCMGYQREDGTVLTGRYRWAYQ